MDKIMEHPVLAIIISLVVVITLLNFLNVPTLPVLLLFGIACGTYCVYKFKL
jgi:hypothetical protein